MGNVQEAVANTPLFHAHTAATQQQTINAILLLQLLSALLTRNAVLFPAMAVRW
jgi:hypothetical protein